MASRTSKAKPRPKAGTSRQAAEDRRKAFIEAYLANGRNGREAAISAGFAPKGADATASKLIREPKVAAQLDARRAEISARMELSTDRTLREVARLAYSDPRKFYNADGSLKAIHELDDDCAATIASVEVDEITAGDAVIGLTRKLKQWDKNAALEKAMKFHGSYEKDNKQGAAQIRLVVVPAKDAA